MIKSIKTFIKQLLCKHIHTTQYYFGTYENAFKCNNCGKLIYRKGVR